MKLKQSQLNRDIHHPIIFKIKNIRGDILYENKFCAFYIISAK